jgi:ABC-2 type transport system permease protein
MEKILLIAQHTSKEILQKKSVRALICLFGLLLIYAGIIGMLQYKKAEAARAKYQKEVRDSWVNSPDKHPHRMAHYGFIAFRPKSSLSFFDYGMESYTGNVIFLEAHKQNSTNFSEASLSTAMLRFGEISIAMVLQILLPLFIFFIGFNVIATDRENGTLKVLIAQGLSWKELLMGKIIGITKVAAYIFIPAFLYTIILNAFINTANGGWSNLLLAFALYGISIFIYSSIAVAISALCKTSKLALVSLIGLWLVLFVVLPRATQALAGSVYAIPSKIAFESTIEEDILKEGDSHNPDDAHYKNLKDSVLKANNVENVQQLNFNYSGFQMKEGERISAEIYNKHLVQLNAIYQRQNKLLGYTAFFNPYIGVKQISMSLSNTDFYTYTNFQQQAEDYRYALAQEMNDLQIKLISNKKLADTAKAYSIDKKNWAAFKDFTYKQPALSTAIKNEWVVLLSIFFWLAAIILLTQILSKTLKVI